MGHLQPISSSGSCHVVVNVATFVADQAFVSRLVWCALLHLHLHLHLCIPLHPGPSLAARGLACCVVLLLAAACSLLLWIPSSDCPILLIGTSVGGKQPSGSSAASAAKETNNFFPGSFCKRLCRRSRTWQFCFCRVKPSECAYAGAGNGNRPLDCSSRPRS
ncbi:hypothetical protein B0T19DRAFT_44466 [Cercophora scortea]|uniref:Uncharacterized protein n=1 Tax=Cercophora scortea TaxID=314031 RepID=A0AAE0J5J5_9PEZI|nr:hypothetical protein B0T19DRAFT_44466 [Cercophora scortea]